MNTHGGKRDGAGRRRGAIPKKTMTLHIEETLLDEIRKKAAELDMSGNCLIRLAINAGLRQAIIDAKQE